MHKPQKIAELRTLPSGRLILEGPVAEILVQWRDLSVEERGHYFVRYNSQNFLGSEVDELKIE